ncbi:MAG TPA: hypothetical protein VMB80_04995 [Candidatus Acidoferrum sp.]|nr:hypothetical protein [Candidatus Acidoferrum sp.]
MADIPQNIPGSPAGAVPPAKKETGKVQPKKETVRINLPPKPSTAPTIKLPTLPPGGPTGAPSATPPPAPAAKPAAAAAAPATRSTVSTAAAPAAQPRPTAPAPKAAAGAPSLGTLDQVLIMAAAVVGLIAIGTTVWMLLMLNSAIAG